MKVIFTEQSFKSLEESLQFLMDDQQVPEEKVTKIGKKLIKKASNLAENPYLGSIEEYLKHLEKGHRKLIEGNFKIIYRVEE
ncbi:type II toxin-antitoxin system RelE/ParE family toxin [Algoriphagus hitonicola]|uniref:ParE toxin of type II toxin-antitoxin system, parDE n=1 Tax=Algoriphagus hitonicola TaxID=435880 RepID=A0A1I2T4B6_9BACT|nr:type II toxin-antitoxin system RelE/ParE family toxin [Algoriphagus hitonicola]SFG59618.1 ParE toxin of type II toxin-antitoxin system, parDE [Algoriphagus hitonicola]